MNLEGEKSGKHFDQRPLSARWAESKGLLIRSATYALGSVLQRGVSFVLLPVYTAYLSTSDFGTIAVATAVTGVLSILMPLGAHGALARFYLDASPGPDRERTLATLWVISTLGGASIATVLTGFSGSISPLLFEDPSGTTYFRVSVWTAFFSSFALQPMVLLQLEERAVAYASCALGVTALQSVLTVTVVAVYRLGPKGYLFGMLLAAGVAAIGYIAFVGRWLRSGFRTEIIVPVFVYSLPLVFHGIAAWLLNLSDRWILARYVPLSDLGLYAIGYQLGMALEMVTMGLNGAWIPFAFRKVDSAGDDVPRELAGLASHFALLIFWAATGLALMAGHILTVMTAPQFHAAAALVPWIAAGYLCNALYFVPGNFLFIRKRTHLVPLCTLIAGLVNVSLNLWLVPTYGIRAAAWTTVASFAAMMALAFVFAQRVYPVPYQFGRLFRIVVAAALVYAAGSMVSIDHLVLNAGLRLLAWSAFVPLLVVLGFWSRNELRSASQFLRSRAASEGQP